MSEHEKLKSSLFEGAPSWATGAECDASYTWYWFDDFDGLNRMKWLKCKNQPSTNMHWMDSTVRRYGGQ